MKIFSFYFSFYVNYMLSIRVMNVELSGLTSFSLCYLHLLDSGSQLEILNTSLICILSFTVIRKNRIKMNLCNAMFNCESTGFATSDHVTSQLFQWRHRDVEIVLYTLFCIVHGVDWMVGASGFVGSMLSQVIFHDAFV